MTGAHARLAKRADGPERIAFGQVLPGPLVFHPAATTKFIPPPGAIFRKLYKSARKRAKRDEEIVGLLGPLESTINVVNKPLLFDTTIPRPPRWRRERRQ